MLTTHNLSFAYPGQPPLHFPDLHCPAGSHWLLLGKSGSGKTTWLHLLAGMLRPSGGHIRLDDAQPHALPDAQLDRWRGQHVGIVFQKAHFVQGLTVEDNLRLAQYLAGVRPERARLRAMLAQLNLADKHAQPTYQLSQGEQQRVAIARALVNRPRLILADEPTSALDDDNCQEVARLLMGRARELEANLLIVTHDARLKALFEHQVSL